MPGHKKTFRPVLAYHNRSIAILLAQLEKHNKILLIIRSALPKAVAKHLLYCVINEKRLLLYTESAAWASQLRFYIPLIQETVNTQADATIAMVKVRIHMQNGSTQQKRRTLFIPADEIIETIRSDMLSAPESDLKDALIRLIERLKTHYDEGGRG